MSETPLGLLLSPVCDYCGSFIIGEYLPVQQEDGFKARTCANCYVRGLTK